MGLAHARRTAQPSDPLAPEPNPQCQCDLTGLHSSSGQQLMTLGCASWGHEGEAGSEAYCYVQGGLSCPGAMPSAVYPGVVWVSCEKPNFAELFPSTGELITRVESETLPTAPPIAFEAPPANMADLTAGSPAALAPMLGSAPF